MAVLLALVSAFAGLAILLVGVGVYGVVSRVVQSQMRSLGIRLALGATPASVRRSIGGDAIRLGAVGSAAGAARAAALWVWLPPQVLGRTLIDGPIVTLAIGVSVCFVPCCVPTVRCSASGLRAGLLPLTPSRRALAPSLCFGTSYVVTGAHRFHPKFILA